MLTILLTILKIIGIVLLAILCLLLLMSILLLVVPIRYRVHALHGEVYEIEAKVSWLLHLVTLRFEMNQNKKSLILRILGLKIKDFFVKKDKKKKKHRKKSAKKKPEKKSSKHSDRKKQTKHVKTSEEQKQLPNQSKDLQNSKKIALTEHNYKEDVPNLETTEDNVNKMREENVVNTENTGNTVYHRTSENNVSTKPASIKNQEEQEEGAKLSRFWDKLIHPFQVFFRTLKRIYDGIINTFTRVKEIIISIFESIKKIFNNGTTLREFIAEAENKVAFSYFFETLKRILKHVGPYKVKSVLHFGTGDPCSTGQALGAISVIRAYTNYNITITPDFENKVLEGEHKIKGRIIPIVLLVVGIKLIIDDRTKRFRTNLNKLKEAL